MLRSHGADLEAAAASLAKETDHKLRYIGDALHKAATELG
jgi:hypothetical protein